MLVTTLHVMHPRQTVSERPTPPDLQAVEWLSQLLLQSLSLKASDIHLEPFENLLRVRIRRDGHLYEMPAPPASLREQIISRIKVQSRMDIAEKRLPQDGRLQLALPQRSVDMRVSSLPTLHGEKMVLRILDVQLQPLSFETLGLPDKELAQLQQAIHRPNGMVLITGPTGSGKTVTLYTCLNQLNTPAVNIATVEDPSEIVLPGANQINVNERIGLTFDVALRALLRQDPDILMVGEIRDLATADMAVKASQTGHLVLSTLHTNDAPSTLTRLNHMGIAGFNLASSVVLICAQRLLRRLCDACKQPRSDRAGYRAVGCPQCLDGYKGRLAIHQVMPITPSLQPLVLQQASTAELAAQAARDGVRSLREAGMCKVEAGETTVDEVMAATHD
jgi:type IV pilus assembly protein PilB